MHPGVARGERVDRVRRGDDGDAAATDTLRTAIDEHITARRSDPEFQKRLNRIMEEDRKILERLAK